MKAKVSIIEVFLNKYSIKLKYLRVLFAQSQN